MTFDIHREAEPHTGGSAFEPLTGAASRVKKSLRSRSGGLLTSTALVSVGFALVADTGAARCAATCARRFISDSIKTQLSVQEGGSLRRSVWARRTP